MDTRNWKFAAETEIAAGYLLETGELVHDSRAAKDWPGTTIEAEAEGKRRADAYENRYSCTCDSVIMESQGIFVRPENPDQARLEL